MDSKVDGGIRFHGRIQHQVVTEQLLAQRTRRTGWQHGKLGQDLGRLRRDPQVAPARLAGALLLGHGSSMHG